MQTTINIPFGFDYRVTKVNWNESRARITGWAKRLDGTVDGQALMAQINWGGVFGHVRYSRRRLPEGEWENLWVEAYTDDDVERVFSGFEPSVLVPSGKTYLEDEELRENSTPQNAWQLREEFLRLEPTSKETLAFLNKWGHWNSAEFVELPEIAGLQRAIRAAVTSSPTEWFTSQYSLPSDWRRGTEFPHFFVLTDKAEVALRMTVTIDLLNRSEFKTCARMDCRQPFKVESEHERKFCSRYCGHLEAVRRSRKTNKRKQVV